MDPSFAVVPVPWRRLETQARVQIGGLGVVLIAEILDGPQHPIEVRFVAVADAARIAHLRLPAAAKPALAVPGGLPAGTVLDVFTVEGFRRLGVARSLWSHACATATAEHWAFQPRHSASRTPEGERYAKAVGGFVPPLASARYVECPDGVDPSSALWRGRLHLNLEAARG
ncbi:hypothetical protein [Micromonospora sp. NPDC049204]|uniref:hypothetical protein n=1 Tax=Micromonospora sp. NPDC049204 TaxID=3154351 RepID=UPI0033C24413